MPSDLHRNESDVVEVIGARAVSPALILCEHASNHIPARYDGLGLDDAARASHAAWDPGARTVAVHLAEALHAPMVAARVSRLVYDCNRPPEAASAMPERSEQIEVPGNRGLNEAQRAERVASVYEPFCARVTEVIAARKAAGLATALITIHSFTPVWFGAQRDCEIGILHDNDTRLADAMLAEAHHLPHRVIRRNDPYGPQDGVTHSLKLHGLAHGLPNVMIEIRNDLLTDARAQAQMAEEILTLLRPALAVCVKTAEGSTHA
ncbi:Predicted N-formylglutamate amidohydrolase [Roseovarius azorensis]|uniref:Predicted N-formylglutamate amidohydrolase n=1 Tax=Roseovarius azorensis TaxID=1287727 RepID=A0A1H7FKV2_9RHOB|nr:N-formylglutamate amidohydrolase [Roseovarius azorensis]SEK26619.1 Predicted N-formylglutamate amidohydrolase [Roseovarius azorensis]